MEKSKMVKIIREEFSQETRQESPKEYDLYVGLDFTPRKLVQSELEVLTENTSEVRMKSRYS